MDISLLAQSVTALLTPYLPYLVKPGEKALEEISKKVGGEAWEGAKALWAKLWPKVEAKPAALEAAHDLAQAPDDADAQATLRQQLKKLLAEDGGLAAEVAHLMQHSAASINIVASGDGAVGIGGDVSGSTIITGDRNRIQK